MVGKGDWHMRGIYIQNMEMPKSCWDCFACRDGWCIINQKIEGHRTVTHSCPLVAVPDHGRLIDADALLLHLLTAESGKVYNYCYPCKEVIQAIKESPTIIAAMNAINEMPTIIPPESEDE